MAIISNQALSIVKATAPIVKEHAEQITTIFYPLMLGRHPELYKYFNEANQQHSTTAADQDNQKPNKPSKQSKTLADAIVAYAMNIEHLENLSDTVERICHKHCALGVTAEDYQIVHDNLMEAIGIVLGDAVTEQVAAAWSEAVMALANILIQTESNLYEQAAKEQWTGVREFKITHLIDESQDIVCIRMVPTDGKGTAPHQPGQYISVYEKPPHKKYFAPRHYTVTSQSGDEYYEIAVKKNKTGSVRGVMSHLLHEKTVGDTIRLGPVFGPAPLKTMANNNSNDNSNDNKKDLPSTASRVAAFVSVGVGVTPTIAMLPTAMKEYGRVAVFHGDKSADTMAYKGLIGSMVPRAGGIVSLSFSGDANCGCPYVSEGRLSASRIVERLRREGIDYVDGVDFFMCAGPSASPILYRELVGAGVRKERIHLEYFGPFVSAPSVDECEGNQVGVLGLGDVGSGAKEVESAGCPFGSVGVAGKEEGSGVGCPFAV